MKKQVAGTIMVNDDQGTRFLMQQLDGIVHFYRFQVLDGMTPLASVLWKLRHEVGIDVDQLRLFDSVMAEIEGEKVSLFVFNHMNVTPAITAHFKQTGLSFVPASQLHQLFEQVNVAFKENSK
ncbi:hypothetical protein [Lactiplantibacillus fabifermentans]|uniref:Uncharacterized protein n=2 Tax=Lactiplantibacillus fabifermentans TaxID=483011 RepID=A0A0R2NPL4_9LACO|nr:hypothetical protein [Lactiplantibacillus fabifermentans]ETY73796.1 hypothetical protein LFAB_10045 [Lactiplantibacillus fabifermentans T30PCM01]KRO25811.1 hypothetical protein DY78_GL001113 [Lactiplantibacillus fabifermentans DSM 21115]